LRSPSIVTNDLAHGAFVVASCRAMAKSIQGLPSLLVDLGFEATKAARMVIDVRNFAEQVFGVFSIATKIPLE